MPVVSANHNGNGAPSSQSSTTGAGAGNGFWHILKILAGDAGHVGKNQVGNTNQKEQFAELTTENDDNQILSIESMEEFLQNTQLEQPGQAFPYNITPGTWDMLVQQWLQSSDSGRLEQMTTDSVIMPKLVELLQILALDDYSPSNQSQGGPTRFATGNAAPEIMELLEQLRLQTGDGNGFNQTITNTAANDAGADFQKSANVTAMINHDDLSPEQLLRLLLAINISGKTAIPGNGNVSLQDMVNQWQSMVLQREDNTTLPGIVNQWQGMNLQKKDNAINSKGWQGTQNNISALDAAKKINTETASSNALLDSEMAYGRSGAEKQAVKVNLFASMPVNRQMINTVGINSPGLMPGEVSQDGSAGHQQLDVAQVGANLTSATANTARATGHETATFLRNIDTPLFTQLAEAVRGHVIQNGQGQTQIRLQLHPASLGEVNIKLTYQDGNITTHFHAATEQARQAIESSIHQLRETLAGYQLNLQSATVSAGDDGNRWGQQENHGQQFKKRPGHFVNGPGKTGETTTAAGTETTQAGSINRLNYFA